MGAGGAAGGTMRSISTRVPTTISRRTTTIILKNTRRNRIRAGSIIRRIERVPSIRTRTRHRSTGNSVPGPGAGQPHLTHGVTAVAEGREAAQDLRPVTSVVAGTVKVQVTEGAVEELRPVTSVVAEARRVRLVAAAEEANGRPAIAARRAVALPHAARAVRGGLEAAAAVDRAAAEEGPLEVEEAEVGEQE